VHVEEGGRLRESTAKGGGERSSSGERERERVRVARRL
jgi:hypothetical protein